MCLIVFFGLPAGFPALAALCRQQPPCKPGAKGPKIDPKLPGPKARAVWAGSWFVRTLCYAIVPPGRESAFRAGFGPDCFRKEPRSALRPAEGRLEGRFRCFPTSSPAKIRPGRPISGPEALLRNMEYQVHSPNSTQHRPRKFGPGIRKPLRWRRQLGGGYQ